MSSLEHKHIIKFLKFTEAANLKYSNGRTTRVPVMFTEFGKNGDFGTHLEKIGPLSDEMARTYFHQIVETLEYIHEKQICHFDIKPENFVLDGDYNLKLCDFGCSRKIAKTDSFRGIVGTNTFLAPEAHLDQFYSGKKLEIFSCGVMLFAMMTGRYPFEQAIRKDELFNLICERKFSRFWAIHKETLDPSVVLSEELQDLIIRMLKKYPSDRITLDGIKSHAWFQGPVVSADKLAKVFI